MTLPTSGQISLADVMNELRIVNSGRQYPISLGDTDVMALAGISSGSISFSNLNGKSTGIIVSILIGREGANAELMGTPYPGGGPPIPNSIYGQKINGIWFNNTGGSVDNRVNISMIGNLPKTFFSTVIINGVSLYASQALDYYFDGYYTRWDITDTSNTLRSYFYNNSYTRVNIIFTR